MGEMGFPLGIKMILRLNPRRRQGVFLRPRSQPQQGVDKSQVGALLLDRQQGDIRGFDEPFGNAPKEKKGPSTFAAGPRDDQIALVLFYGRRDRFGRMIAKDEQGLNRNSPEIHGAEEFSKLLGGILFHNFGEFGVALSALVVPNGNLIHMKNVELFSPGGDGPSNCDLESGPGVIGEINRNQDIGDPG